MLSLKKPGNRIHIIILINMRGGGEDITVHVAIVAHFLIERNLAANRNACWQTHRPTQKPTQKPTRCQGTITAESQLHLSRRQNYFL